MKEVQITTLPPSTRDPDVQALVETTLSSDYQEYLTDAGWDFRPVRHLRFFGEGPGTLYLLSDEGGAPRSLARVTPLDWDRDVFGHAVARIDAIAGGSAAEKRALVQGICDVLDREGVHLLTCRIRGGDFATLHALEAAGFHTVDGLSVFLHDRDQGGFPERPLPERVELAPYDPADKGLRAQLAAIASESFRYSRVNNDPMIDNTTARRFFGQMSQSLLEHPAAVSQVVRMAGQPVGFALGEEDRELSAGLGVSIGYLWLIGLAGNAAGRGIGGALLHSFGSAFHQHARLLEIATQTTNLPALNLYSRFGLPVVASIVTLHRWSPGRGQG